MRRDRLTAAAIFLAAGIVVLCGGEDGAAGGTGPGAVNPFGKPAAFKSGKGSMAAVWFDKGAWHLSGTTKKGGKEIFTGSVRVNLGRMIGNFGKLEKSSKPDEADYVLTHPDGRGFDFLLTNFGLLDSINFKASGEATELRFDVKIAGRYHPERVLVGKKGVHPQAIPFTLPAHPSK